MSGVSLYRENLPLDPAPGSHREMLRILLVDDDVLRTEVTRAILEGRFQCKVEAAYNAWSAIEELSSSRFDLLVTDYHMPNVNGFQLAKVVRGVWPAVPILMLTGDSAVPEAAKTLVDEFVEKGWPTEVFIGRVERILPNRQSIVANHS